MDLLSLWRFSNICPRCSSQNQFLRPTELLYRFWGHIPPEHLNVGLHEASHEKKWPDLIRSPGNSRTWLAELGSYCPKTFHAENCSCLKILPALIFHVRQCSCQALRSLGKEGRPNGSRIVRCPKEERRRQLRRRARNISVLCKEWERQSQEACCLNHYTWLPFPLWGYAKHLKVYSISWQYWHRPSVSTQRFEIGMSSGKLAQLLQDHLHKHIYSNHFTYLSVPAEDWESLWENFVLSNICFCLSSVCHWSVHPPIH